MWIDVPIQNQTYIRPDNTSIIIGGWAVSNDSNSSLQVLVDEKIINTNITRFVRTDVDSSVSKKYGGASLSPKAGFNTKVDITALSKGNHKIKIREISRFGDIICEISRDINVENKKYSRKNMD